MSHVVKVPAERVERDVGRVTRRWWKAKNLGDAASQTTLGEAMLDVSRLGLAYLARTLDSSRSSHEDKLRIALALAPRLLAETRGRPARGRMLEAEAVAGDLGSLLEGYQVGKVTAKIG